MNKLNYNLNIINTKYYIDSRDVKENSLALERSEQEERENYRSKK